jgi:hypothetical protein
MNIALRLEKEHSKRTTDAIVNYVGSDPARFRELIDVLLKGEKRLSQRAAWPLSDVAVKQPQLVYRYLAKLIHLLIEDETPDPVKRNILRTLQASGVPENYEALAVDACFRFIRNETMPVAIRAFSITVAAGICKKYPELASELKLMLEEIVALPHTPAVRVRIKKALKEL